MEIQWRCLKCLAVNGGEAEPPGVGPWRCAKCGADEPAHPEAVRGAGSEARIAGCPACGCPDVFRQRDFNRKLGFAIVALGAALAPFTHYVSIVACLLIDVAIYRFMPDVVVCYHCHATMRGYPGEAGVEAYDLNVSDKYLKIERERGW